MFQIPTYTDVAAAAGRIKGGVHRTAVVTSRIVDEETGAKVFFKCECVQRTGAFKFRGAFNALSKLDERQRRNGVVAFSSGNHAQAIALSSFVLGIPATVVMRRDATTAKLAAAEAYGGKVTLYDKYTEDREAIGRALAEEHGLTLIPSYDHPDVIAGQGAAAMELFEEVGDLDALFVPLGGGGLLEALRSPRRPWLWIAKSTVLRQWLETTGSNRSRPVPLCISTPRKPLPMALRLRTSGPARSRLSAATWNSYTRQRRRN
jgi:threonine dehydratase